MPIDIAASDDINDWEIRREARNYYQMDRIVQRNPEYAVGLAMHSSRTKNFESNEEWINGYHTANGMMYLILPNDPLQYTGNYFFTVDQNRLPGTTVSLRTRDLTNLSNDNPNIPKPWLPAFKGEFVGGVTSVHYHVMHRWLSLQRRYVKWGMLVCPYQFRLIMMVIRSWNVIFVKRDL